MSGLKQGAPHTVDRHVFASNASVYNSAWETVGRSRALDPDRSGRLEERVPWATDLVDAKEPPVLIGEAGELAPLTLLPFAFLPLDNRLGLSVSGVVVGATGATRVGSAVRPRVATQTLLFDESLFRQIDGFPFGLLSTGAVGVAPDRWFQAFRRAPLGLNPELATVLVSEGPEVRKTFARARLAAVAVLSERVKERLGPKVVCDVLAGIYRGVAKARSGGPPSVVVVVKDSQGGLDPVAVRDLVTLAWLSLPLADRCAVYCSTSWLARATAPCITVAPPAETLARLMAAGRVRVVAPGPLNPEPADLQGPSVFEGWASLVLNGADAFARASLRVDTRRGSLFDPGFEAFLSGASTLPKTTNELVDRIRRELRGHGRLRASGRLTAEVLIRSSEPQRVAIARWLLAGERPCREPRFNDGLVRGLRGKLLDFAEESGTVARAAVQAGLAAGRTALGLGLAVDGLSTLIRQGQGLPELVGSVGSVARSEGAASGTKMLRIGLGLLRASERWDDIPDYLLGVDEVGFAEMAVTADIANALWDHRSPGGGWHLPLLRLWGQAVAHGVGDEDELHRLAWVEHERLGAPVLSRLARQGDPGVHHFAKRFIAHDPPLPVFLQLRNVVGLDLAPPAAGMGA